MCRLYGHGGAVVHVAHSLWLGDSQTPPVVWNVFVRSRQVRHRRFVRALRSRHRGVHRRGRDDRVRHRPAHRLSSSPTACRCPPRSSDQAAYAVIEPDALGAHSGKQTMTVSGSDTVFVSYGRSSDVAAWLGDTPYVAVGYDAEAEEFTSDVVVSEPVARRRFAGRCRDPTRSPPATTEGEAARGRSGGIADRVRPLARRVQRRAVGHHHDRRSRRHLGAARQRRHGPGPVRPRDLWPLDNSTPWAGPLIVGGALVFLGGLGCSISGFMHHRRSRGPRRNLPKGPRGKLPSAPKPRSIRRSQVSGGRRAIGRVEPSRDRPAAPDTGRRAHGLFRRLLAAVRPGARGDHRPRDRDHAADG